MGDSAPSKIASAAPEVSNLHPAPPPEVNPWKKSLSSPQLAPQKESIELPDSLTVPANGKPQVQPAVAKAKKTGKQKWVPLEAEISVSSPTKTKNKSANGNSKKKDTKQNQSKRTNRKKPALPSDQQEEKNVGHDTTTITTISDMSSATTEGTDTSDEKTLAKLASQLTISSSERPETAPPTSGSEATLDNGFTEIAATTQDQDSEQYRDPHIQRHQRSKSFNGNNMRYDKKNRNLYSRSSANLPSLPPYPILSSTPYYVPYYMPPVPPYGVSMSPTSSRRNSQMNSQASSRSSPKSTNDLRTSTTGERSSHHASPSRSPETVSPSIYGDPNLYYGVMPGIPPHAGSPDPGSPVPYFHPYYMPPPTPGFPLYSSQAPYSPTYPGTAENYGDDKVGRLIKQLEYYFSMENLLKDIYLRKHMNSEGYVSVAFIAGFSRVKILSEGDSNLILQALKRTNLLEMSGPEKSEVVRLKEGWERWVLPQDQREL
ncbi:hypothetical protein KL942_003481 [Ogataea angusta]|uniref:HTH La-type RNA-binding domain-containing protein n=1 Tax=Pichia angusta TaxID=870730 RepID=A0ABQ7RXG9_PICAN|nr:hypothetical protein KL920_003396 [Ogataea angusta]KAG7839119.1 hypothetical protein KL942_003481 [Ogataea angusta]KAG7849770.1 hypothetical protein KL940_002800 [Ogataea angusta]